MSALRTLLIGLTGAAAIGCAAHAADISGAGATFPYPVYAKWAEAYAAKTGVKMNYQSIGSGGGIKQITANTVDFGASDMPLTPEILEKNGLMQFPTVMGGVIPVVNLKGIDLKPGEMKLDGTVLADIYLAKVKYWDDPEIKKLNADLKLPHKAIAAVHRSDGSGTNFIFTHYLSSIDPEFKEKIGANTAVEFPSGIGAKGNEGVAAMTQRTDGAIGYVEYAYVVQNKLTYAQLRNQDGHFVAPSSHSFQAAAAGAEWAKAPGFYLLLTNQPGSDSWPIAGATFILLHKVQRKPPTGREVINFFDWAFRHGDKLAESLDYVPLPDNVVKLIENAWRTEVKGTDGKPVWTGSGS